MRNGVSGKRPNFLLIVADDLGYSDVGCYGSEIKTPNIDRLAKEGMLFTDFHAAAACSPTRAMLLSGTDNHLSGMGVMAEGKGTADDKWYTPGYEGYMNFDVAALPEILADGGYYNILSGKWHLGFKPECNPANRGFHRSLALLPGQTNHFAYHPELNHHNAFFERMPILHTEQGKRKIFPTNVQNEYDTGFYSTTSYTDNLIHYLEERTLEEKEKPFFAMLPFAAPHWPLQCSKEDREKYQGMYDDGPSALRDRRVANLKRLGVIDQSVIPHETIQDSFPGKKYTQWEEMTEAERAKSARAMETYAGMVDCIDRCVGQVMEHLESIGEADDTFVCFMSDNGSEGAAIEAWPTLGKDILDIAHRYFSNKLDNIGNHDSFVWYGPRWAQASTAPSKLYKMYSTEGGIRVPFIVRYPRGHWPQDQMVRGFSTVMDIVPTILDMAGISHPVPAGKSKGTFHGRTVNGLRGKSWIPALEHPGGFVDGPEAFHGNDSFMGWELSGRAALRKGKWKMVNMPSTAFGTGAWQLYDIFADPGERIDLATQHPDVLEDLLKDWETYVKETGTQWGTSASGQREAFGSAPTDAVGGDPVEQCTAWMDVGEGQVARKTLPDYDNLPGVTIDGAGGHHDNGHGTEINGHGKAIGMSGIVNGILGH